MTESPITGHDAESLAAQLLHKIAADKGIHVAGPEVLEEAKTLLEQVHHGIGEEGDAAEPSIAGVPQLDESVVVDSQETKTDAQGQAPEPREPQEPATTVSPSELFTPTLAITEQVKVQVAEQAGEFQQPDGHKAPIVKGTVTGGIGNPVVVEDAQRVIPVPAPRKLRLRNANEGKEYAFELDGQVQLAEKAGESNAAPGVSFDHATGSFSGLPTSPGEFVYVFTEVSNPNQEVRAELTVNPDPAKLWIETDSNEGDFRFWKPDHAAEVLKMNGVLALAASKRGRSHGIKGGCRDDDFVLKEIVEPRWCIAVVADGAGSAEFSRRGSQIVVAVVAQELERLLSSEWTSELEAGVSIMRSESNLESQSRVRDLLAKVLPEAARAACNALESEAEKENVDLDSLSTTLIITASHPLPDGSWFVSGFSVGDGGAGVISSPPNLNLLTTPDSGEYAGQTVFLRSKEFENDALVSNRIHFHTVKSPVVLLAMTDGISDPKLPTDDDFNNLSKWQDLWAEVEADVVLAGDGTDAEFKANFLKWIHFLLPGYHDDRTLAILKFQDS